MRPVLKGLRHHVARRVERRLLGPEPATIIAEDCWGGEFCRVHGCAYTTPLASAYIEPPQYLDFLENITARDAFSLSPCRSNLPYPVGGTPYAVIHFMHARDFNEVAAAFARRTARMNRERFFCKIDFGKAGYGQRDVERWNALALPRAVALIPPVDPPKLDLRAVHQGVRMGAWTHDGATMLHWSRRWFDFHHWLRTGLLRRSQINRALHFLLWDGHAAAEAVHRLRFFRQMRARN